MTLAAMRGGRAAIPSGERIVGERIVGGRIVMGLKLGLTDLLFK
jgi:hypothetical protein